jgi:hypothetical protein
MPSKLILKKSSVTDKAPVAGDLEYGELALNYADKRLYFKATDDSIQRFDLKLISTSISSAATITPDSGADTYEVSALAVAATIAAPTGVLRNNQRLLLKIKDDGTARALTWNATYRPIEVTLPTTTVANKTLYVGCIYNLTDSYWDVLAVGQA